MRPPKPLSDDAPGGSLSSWTSSEQRDLDEHQEVVLPYTTTQNLPVVWVYDFEAMRAG